MQRKHDTEKLSWGSKRQIKHTIVKMGGGGGGGFRAPPPHQLLFFKNIPYQNATKHDTENVHGIFKGKENMKLKQEACRSDSSAIYNWLSGHKTSYQKSVQTLLKITHLASRKSKLVIICPNSYGKFTKSEIKLELVQTLLKIIHLASRKSYTCVAFEVFYMYLVYTPDGIVLANGILHYLSEVVVLEPTSAGYIWNEGC